MYSPRLEHPKKYQSAIKFCFYLGLLRIFQATASGAQRRPLFSYRDGLICLLDSAITLPNHSPQYAFFFIHFTALADLSRKHCPSDWGFICLHSRIVLLISFDVGVSGLDTKLGTHQRKWR